MPVPAFQSRGFEAGSREGELPAPLMVKHETGPGICDAQGSALNGTA